jgi:hypothetical protein
VRFATDDERRAVTSAVLASAAGMETGIFPRDAEDREWWRQRVLAEGRRRSVLVRTRTDPNGMLRVLPPE